MVFSSNLSPFGVNNYPLELPLFHGSSGQHSALVNVVTTTITIIISAIEIVALCRASARLCERYPTVCFY